MRECGCLGKGECDPDCTSGLPGTWGRMQVYTNTCMKHTLLQPGQIYLAIIRLCATCLNVTELSTCLLIRLIIVTLLAVHTHTTYKVIISVTQGGWLCHCITGEPGQAVVYRG